MLTKPQKIKYDYDPLQAMWRGSVVVVEKVLTLSSSFQEQRLQRKNILSCFSGNHNDPIGNKILKMPNQNHCQNHLSESSKISDPACVENFTWKNPSI